MSYCRWSSDNWRSDVYVYEDTNGGWTTHIAGRRRTGLDTLPPDPLTLDMSDPEWLDKYKAHDKALEALPFEEINLPLVGKSFNDSDPGACADRLEMLRGLGYHVPQYAIDELREEARTFSA